MSHVVRVSLLPQLLAADGTDKADAAVVIDTLRFTTTACQALAAGACSVTVASDIETAKSLAAPQLDADSENLAARRPLLCGERHCQPIAGFDLGNSPYEYAPSTVSGRDLIFTTTNGTRAVSAARHASLIYLAGLVNRTAVARCLLTTVQPMSSRYTWIVCSGTDGEVAAEDVLAAGAIIDALGNLSNSIVLGNDAAGLSLALWQQCQAPSRQLGKTGISRLFQQCRGGKNLIENGYERDLVFAEQVDALDVVPFSKLGAFERFTVA